eukprot:IDg7722t1
MEISIRGYLDDLERTCPFRGKEIPKCQLLDVSNLKGAAERRNSPKSAQKRHNNRTEGCSSGGKGLSTAVEECLLAMLVALTFHHYAFLWLGILQSETGRKITRHVISCSPGVGGRDCSTPSVAVHAHHDGLERFRFPSSERVCWPDNSRLAVCRIGRLGHQISKTIEKLQKTRAGRPNYTTLYVNSILEAVQHVETLGAR